MFVVGRAPGWRGARKGLRRTSSRLTEPSNSSVSPLCPHFSTFFIFKISIIPIFSICPHSFPPFSNPFSIFSVFICRLFFLLFHRFSIILLYETSFFLTFSYYFWFFPTLHVPHQECPNARPFQLANFKGLRRTSSHLTEPSNSSVCPVFASFFHALTTLNFQLLLFFNYSWLLFPFLTFHVPPRVRTLPSRNCSTVHDPD